MKYLGTLDEMVMLATGILGEAAYGVAIQQEIAQRTGRSLSVGVLHAVLQRLERAGYLRSHFGEATAVRGGKRKRYYRLTAHGHAALQEARALRDQLWAAFPRLAWD